MKGKKSRVLPVMLSWALLFQLMAGPGMIAMADDSPEQPPSTTVPIEKPADPPPVDPELPAPEPEVPPSVPEPPKEPEHPAPEEPDTPANPPDPIEPKPEAPQEPEQPEEPAEPAPVDPPENPEKEEDPEKEDEAPEVEPVDEEWETPKIPSKYEEIQKKILESKAIFDKEPSLTSAKTYAYYVAYLPIRSEFVLLDNKENAINNLLKDISKISDKKEMAEAKLFFVTTLMNRASKGKIPFEVHILEELIEQLPASVEKRALQKEFTELIRWFRVNGTLPDQMPGSPGYTGGYKPPVVIDDGLIPGYKPSRPETTNPPVIPFIPHETSTSTHKMQGETCVRITTYYSGGKQVRTETSAAIGGESSLCYTSSPAPSPSLNDVKFNGYNPYDPKQREALYKKEREEAKAKLAETISIQFTFNPNDESPYYHDTGIVLSKKQDITYKQAVETLQLIALEGNGKFVEDADQVLALFDGTIVRIEEYDDVISFKEFEKLFKNAPIALAAQSAVNTKEELTDQLESLNPDVIFYDGQKYSLAVSLEFENGTTLFPAEQMAKILGGQFKKTGEQFEIKLGDETFTYELNQTAAFKNEELIDLGVPVRTTENGVIMIPIQSLLTALNIELALIKGDLHLQGSL